MKRSEIILKTYSATAILTIIVIILLATSEPDTGERYFAYFFGGVAWIGLLLFLEALIFLIVYIKHFKEVWKTILPLLIIPGLILLWLFSF